MKRKKKTMLEPTQKPPKERILHTDSTEVFEQSKLSIKSLKSIFLKPKELKENSCQTFFESNLITKEIQTNPVTIDAEFSQTDFIKLLDPTHKNRPPRTFEWTLKSIRSIFDEKTVKDLAEIPDNVKNEMKIIPVSKASEVLEIALRK